MGATRKKGRTKNLTFFRISRSRITRKKKRATKRKSKKKKAREREGPLLPAGEAPTVGAYYRGAPPGGDVSAQITQPPMTPLQQAIAAVNETALVKGKGHLRDVRMRRLVELQRMEMPQEHHSGSSMLPPALSRAEAMRIHSAPAPPHPSQEAAAAQEGPRKARGYGPVVRPPAGETVFTDDPVPPRESSATNVFLEESIQNKHDDRLRAIAFIILDKRGLKVSPTQNSERLVLMNPENKKTAVFTKQEFYDAVAFIADRARPPLVEAKNPKIRALIELLPEVKDLTKKIDKMNPEITGIVSPDGPGDSEEMLFGLSYGRIEPEAVRSMTPQQKAHFRSETRKQVNLDVVRDEVEPTRKAERRKGWLEALSFGRYGGPETRETAEGREEIPTKRTAQEVADVLPPGRSRDEARILLEDLQRFKLLDWDEDGQMLDPAKHSTVLGSSVVNVVKHLFNLNSDATRTYLSKFEPTGMDFFVNRVMKAMQARSVDKKNLFAWAKEEGPSSWAYRTVDGVRYSLVKMYAILAPIFQALQMSQWIVIPLLLKMGLINFKHYALYYKMATGMGLPGTDPVTAVGLDGAAGVADYVADSVPEDYKFAMQMGIWYYGSAIAVGTVNASMSLLTSIGSYLARSARGLVTGR